ncbi:hypothetical protein D0U04_30110 [Bacillus clarus]|uniref:Uncharacterized protein n=1 Tax=Bacillus clarus TaxID=2338372 RepID=A0ABX9KM65_9BACI|nr:hypothetical protein D0U04_30110 [Bacillus clarus]
MIFYIIHRYHLVQLDTFTRFLSKKFMLLLFSRVRHLGNTLLEPCYFPCRASFILYTFIAPNNLLRSILFYFPFPKSTSYTYNRIFFIPTVL